MSASQPDPSRLERIGVSGDLLDGGTALNFAVGASEKGVINERNAFAIRFQGQVYGYLNQCAHLPQEMDWQPGKFFDLSGVYLVCATHGALYQPASGYCIDGPCRGRSLQKIFVFEQEGAVYWCPDERFHKIPVKG